MAKIGRPPGSPNKRTLEVQKRLEELDFDPIAMLVSFANDENADPEFRRKCAADILPYVLPRLSAQQVELRDPEGRPTSIAIKLVKADGAG